MSAREDGSQLKNLTNNRALNWKSILNHFQPPNPDTEEAVTPLPRSHSAHSWSSLWKLGFRLWTAGIRSGWAVVNSPRGKVLSLCLYLLASDSQPCSLLSWLLVVVKDLALASSPLSNTPSFSYSVYLRLAMAALTMAGMNLFSIGLYCQVHYNWCVKCDGLGSTGLRETALAYSRTYTVVLWQSAT